MISLNDYAAHDGLGLTELVARKDVTPQELVDAALKAIETVNPKLNAVLQTLPEQAAAEIRGGLPQGPFTGVPFLIKELVLHAKNVRCDMGSKLANNLTAIVNMQTLREGLRLARHAGISEEKMLEVIKASTGNSWAAQNWEAMLQVARNYTTGAKGMAQVGYKDISLAVAVGHDVGASLPITALATQMMEQLFERED